MNPKLRHDMVAERRTHGCGIATTSVADENIINVFPCPLQARVLIRYKDEEPKRSVRRIY